MNYSIFGREKSSISCIFLSEYANKAYWNDNFLKIFQLQQISKPTKNSLFVGLVNKNDLFIKTSYDTISIFNSPFHMPKTSNQTLIVFSENELDKNEMQALYQLEKNVELFLFKNKIKHKNISFDNHKNNTSYFIIQAAFCIQLSA